MMKSIFFIGPAKSGTTSFYLYLLKQKSLTNVVGGKEFDYSKINTLSSFSKNKSVTIFNHNAYFEYPSDLLNSYKWECVFIHRNPFDRAVSGFMQKIKSKKISLKSDSIDFINKSIDLEVDYSNYEKYLKKFTDRKIKVHIIDFNKINDRNYIYKKLCQIYDTNSVGSSVIPITNKQGIYFLYPGNFIVKSLKMFFNFIGMNNFFSLLKISYMKYFTYPIADNDKLTVKNMIKKRFKI